MRAIALFLLLILSACQPHRTVKAYPSPDGRSKLVIQVSDKGGCCSVSYVGTLYVGDDSSQVFTGKGGARIAARWSSPDKVLILADEIDSYELKAFSYRPAVNKPDGSPDGIRVVLLDKGGM